MNTILIVDDQNDVRLRAAEMLRRNGLLPRELYEAATVAAAVELGCRHRPELVLLDVVLPDGTGFDVLNQLREAGIDPKVIMMTAFPQFDYALQAVNSQVRGFLVKPLNENEFVKAISALQGAEEQQKKRHLAYTMLDMYLKGQQFSMQLDEMREATGINRLRGNQYLVLIVSLECSENLENQIMDFWKLLKKEKIDSVNYLQNTATLVAILRDDAPARLIPMLITQLHHAFSSFCGGYACLPAQKGIRAAYQNASFALKYALDGKMDGRLIDYDQIDIPAIVVAKRREALLSREEAGIDQLMLDFSRMEISLPSAREALIAFCNREGMEGDAFSSCDTWRKLQSVLRETLAVAPDDVKRKNHVQLARITDYIECHWQENINRAAIAEALGVSYSYIGELFRAELKQSTTDYIQGIRMKHAEDMLKNTRLSISQIAKRVGYQDSGSFIRVFMKHYQITPGEWRLQMKEEEA